MKRLLLLLTSMLLIAHSMAQYYTPLYASALSRMPSCQGKDVIVRNYAGRYLLIHHTSEADVHEHHFAIQSQDSPSFRELVVMMGGGTESVDVTYEINDIQVLDDTCYFCGTKVVDLGAPALDYWGNIVGSQYQNIGFLGRFALTSIAEDGNAGFEIYEVPTVERLTQLAVTPGRNTQTADFHVMISAIGQMSDSIFGSCVVEAANYVGRGWLYSIAAVEESDNESFVDILSTGSRTYLASFQSASVDNPDAGGWGLILHDVGLHGFAEEYYQSFWLEDAIRYDFGETDWGWHTGGAQLRMTELPNKRIGFSFGSHNSEDELDGLLTASFTDIGCLDTVTLVRTSPDVYVKDIVYLSSVNQLAVLAGDRDYYNRGVFLSKIGYNGNIPVLHKQGMKLQSLCRYTGRTVFTGGFDVMTKYLYAFWQHPQAFERSTCMSVGEAVSSILPRECGEKHPVKWKVSCHKELFDWTELMTTINESAYDMECANPLWFIEIENH